MSTRTITMTGKPPVRINEDNWPLIASFSDKEWDNQYECQANQISKWFVGVRQHEDGRSIVYATYSFSTNWAGRRDYSAGRGVILDATSTDEDVCQAITEVCADIAECEHHGSDAERWNTLRDACITDMPAVEL